MKGEVRKQAMTILILADLHLDHYRQFSTVTESGLNSRLLSQLEVMREVCQIAKQGNVESIIFLGDLINSQGESLPKIIYNSVYLVLSKLAQVAPTYVLIGNHDVYRAMHILSAFTPIKDLTIIDKSLTMKLNGLNVDMVPWENRLPKKHGDILFGHLETKGQDMGGIPSPVGFEKTDYFGYRKIYLGHFHTLHSFEVPGCTEAMYIGAVMQNSYSDTGEQKGVHILDKDWNRTFVPIRSPLFLQATIASQEAMDNFMKNGHNDVDYFRLILRDPDIKLSKFDHRIQIEWDVMPTHEARMEIKESESLREITHNFINTSKTVLDKEAIKKQLDEIMEGVWQ